MNPSALTVSCLKTLPHHLPGGSEEMPHTGLSISENRVGRRASVCRVSFEGFQMVYLRHATGFPGFNDDWFIVSFGVGLWCWHHAQVGV
jgi:hypothetical protein